jgi:peptidoglycan/xylan/chitin deacetylase (PgdA/CDA1 family)
MRVSPKQSHLGLSRHQREHRRRRRRRALALALAAFALATVAAVLPLVLSNNPRGRVSVQQAPVGRSRSKSMARLPGSQSRRRTPAVRLRSAEQRAFFRFLRLGLPVRCGGPHGNYVALTFDDGPGPYTGHALAILRQAHARATFFLVGKELRYWPFLPIEELQIGVLGDHSWTHPYLPRLSMTAIRQQLLATRDAIENETHTPVHLFRPPYGGHDRRVDREAQALGLVDVLWSIDTRDAEGARWDQISANVRRFARPGSIILMHENRGQTIRALRFGILPFLYARHLLPVTVPELLALDPPTLAQIEAGLNGCYGHPRPAAVRGSGG